MGSTCNRVYNGIKSVAIQMSLIGASNPIKLNDATKRKDLGIVLVNLWSKETGFINK